MKNLVQKFPGIMSRTLHLLLLALFLATAACDSTSTAVDTDEDNTPPPSETEDQVFQIAVLPDTQYYTAQKHGGTVEMFQEQITWIKENQAANNIKYVAHLGDLVDHGEQKMVEWERASEIMYQLEAPTSEFPDGIPYGIAVGNHDQEPLGNPAAGGTEDGYNRYFGKDRFKDREYYGGAYSGSGNAENNNDNHYDLFTAEGEKFLVMYIEYNEPGHDEYDLEIEADVLDWAQGVLKAHSDHKAIIVSHSILARPAGSTSITTGGEGDNSLQSEFTKQGKRIYDGLKNSPNVFMMLCGHRSGEGFRKDIHNGNTIKTYLSDYQSREISGVRNGGGGLMRTMEFNLTENTITVRTFSPTSGNVTHESDGDSSFTMPMFE